MAAVLEQKQRLTHLVQSGDAPQKIGPADLVKFLSELCTLPNENLLVGLNTNDDAAVYRISDDIALVQTLDFLTPIVDDPYIYGQIAAANSLSDVYAMGVPLTAMNMVCYPLKDRGSDDLTEILRGGADKIKEAGAILVGGHSVDDISPKFGLSVTGLIHPSKVTSNAGAKPGDCIVLTKPLGVGIISTAAKFDECDSDTLKAACQSMTMLNAAAADAMRMIGIGSNGMIHAATDITGFGLLGHLHHISIASGVSIEIDSSKIPAIPNAEDLAAAGNITSGDRRNRIYLDGEFTTGPNVPLTRINLLVDPQTSGGLAICVAEDGVDELLAALASRHVETRAVIGRVTTKFGTTIKIV